MPTIEEKQKAMQERNEARGRKLTTLKLSRREALNQLAEAIERLPEDDPQKAVMLRSYLNQKGRRRTNRSVKSTKETAVRSAIRNREVIEVTDDNACDVYNKWAPAERRAWRLIWALDEVRDGHTSANHSEYGGPATAEERATATLIHEGKLKPIGYGFDLHHEGFQVFATVEEGSAAAREHQLDCSNCRNWDQFFYHNIYPEAQ
jgi:hypothetical protein